MWIIGVLSLVILVGAVTGIFSRKRTSPTFVTEWDLESLSGEYAAIIAPLAGFSVAAAVFLANLSRVARTSYFADVMALFLIALIMLMATAVMFATFRSARLGPSPSEELLSVHSMLYLICNLGFYLSLSMSWLGLRPLLLSIELSALAEVFTWVLLFSLTLGAIRVGAWLHIFLGTKMLASLLVPIIPIVTVVAYGLVLAPQSAIF